MNWDYCTHVPMLYEATRLTKGMVVELGVGMCSTPLLHALVTYGMEPRQLFSVDDDENWLHVTRSRFKSELHQFVHVTDWSRDLATLIAAKPSLVFVDQGSIDDIPKAEKLRVDAIRQFAGSSEVIIVHDADNIIFRDLGFKEELNKLFDIVVEDTHTKPSTLWLSNSIRPEKLLLDIPHKTQSLRCD